VGAGEGATSSGAGPGEGAGVAARPARVSAWAEPEYDVWRRAFSRDDTWVSVMTDVQRHMRAVTGADVAVLWAQLPPRGNWARLAEQLPDVPILARGAQPHATLERVRRPLRVLTRDVRGPYRRILDQAGVAGGWLFPLTAPAAALEHEPWLGALGLGWHGEPPLSPPTDHFLASGLWYLLRQRVETTYTETVLEDALALGAPASPADWNDRLAAMLRRLGGDHWALYRVMRDAPEGPTLSLVTEGGAFADRGRRLVTFIRATPGHFEQSALWRAVTQRHNVFIADTLPTIFRIPEAFGGDEARAGLVIPLGERGQSGFGLLGVYWRDPAGWQRFGLSMQPWDAFRRVATEWWQSMQTAHDAQRDALTGALNRRGAERAWREIVAARPAGLLAVVDLDAFSEVNNRWGHLMGDEVLRALAAILSDVAETNGGWCGRWGGDEFVLCLGEGVDWPRLGRRVQAALDAAARASHWPQRVTVSGGAARWRRGLSDWTTTFARADRALYRAKRRGGARFTTAR
jgi:diguanylate cyclase (GGDEF)-like protein